MIIINASNFLYILQALFFCFNKDNVTKNIPFFFQKSSDTFSIKNSDTVSKKKFFS